MTLRAISRALSAAAAVLLCAVLAGCSNTPTTPSTTTTPTASTPPTSLVIVDLIVGTGDPAASGDAVTTDYTGWLYDATKPDLKGLQFQTSVGSTPLPFTIGAGQVIEGFDQGVTGMKVGGLRRLIVPASLGYGNQRSGGIPPNTPLIFEITLDSVTPPSTGS
ncbi:MAG: FKBP-type peptidyl-prolyl cis-trans isomerase [Vicinamibacterales bacterium]